MAEILMRFAAVILASGCFISLASCGGNKIAENVAKTEPTETTQAQAVEETQPVTEASSTDLSSLPDNATEERINHVVNEENGRVYNMFLDNDGTVRWIYDNTPNPRLTQQVADFMAENSSLAGLSDFVLSLGISPNPYVANAEDDGYGGSSDPGYYELSWYDDVVSRVNESYNNRESNDQIVFSQDPLTGNIIADDRTVYYDMEPVSVTFNEEYMLAPGWYYYVDTTSQPHRQLKWFRIGPQDGYYASKEYLYSYGIGIQLNELAYTTFSLDHPDMKCYILDESREGFSYRDAYAQIEHQNIRLWNFDVYDINVEDGTFTYEWGMIEIPVGDFVFYSEYTNDYTDEDLYNITFNEIAPNL